MNDKERIQLHLVMEAGQQLLRLIEGLGRSREVSLALTSAEMAVMWARQHLEKTEDRDLRVLWGPDMAEHFPPDKTPISGFPTLR